MTASPPASALVAATGWIAGVLTGPVATGLAVVAIAGVGFGMLTGRIDWRRAVQVVLGVFILFGAPMLVRELTGAVRGDGVAVPDGAGVAPVGPKPAPRAPSASDPYAGAAVVRD